LEERLIHPFKKIDWCLNLIQLYLSAKNQTMKKFLLVISFAFSIGVITQCSSSKKATAKPQVITYTNNIQPIILSNCTPCHFPDKGGRAKSLNSYSAAKDNSDEIIRRVSLQPAEKGFMPFKHPRLSDSTINVFRQWKEGGLVE
jgi:hypothetical protein